MYSLTLKEFLKLSRKGNVIPVYKEIGADLDTPVSVFLKMKRDNYAFLFESVEGQEKIARYSFLGSNPRLIFKSKGRDIRIIHSGAKTKYKTHRFLTATDPLDEIKKIMGEFRAVEIKGLPRFCGGFVGCIGYDMVRFFERIPDKNPDELKIPDAIFILMDTLLAFDHINHTIKIICNAILPEGSSTQEKKRIYRDALKRMESAHNVFRKPLPTEKEKKSVPAPKPRITSNCTKYGFAKMVNRAKAYIKRGDIIQVVLSQRFKVKINQSPFDIYRKLRGLNPSPYMFFLDLKDTALVGSSPEMLVRCENGCLETRPIAGTRRRGKNEEEDNKLAEELLNDEKEKAEHIMLVDLGRNDLGRVSQAGKVNVAEFMGIEKYSHVMHIVSDVTAKLDKKYDIYDALRACFPAGTVSGSPKIRAMEIIEELEESKRSLYAGCVGYFSFSGNMDTCITIRTIVVKGDNAYVQAGAGIVADSVAQKEYTESVNKAKALIEAIIN